MPNSKLLMLADHHHPSPPPPVLPSSRPPVLPYQLNCLDRAIETLVGEICGNPDCPVDVREDIASLKSGCKASPNKYLGAPTKYTPGSFWWHVVNEFEWTFAWRQRNQLTDAWATLYRLRVLADRDFLLFAM